MHILTVYCYNRHIYQTLQPPTVCPHCSTPAVCVLLDFYTGIHIQCLGCKEAFPALDAHDYAACTEKAAWLAKQ